jgi:hypothetical protein
MIESDGPIVSVVTAVAAYSYYCGGLWSQSHEHLYIIAHLMAQ